MAGEMYDELYEVVTSDRLPHDRKMLVFKKLLARYSDEFNRVTSVADTCPRLQSELDLLKTEFRTQSKLCYRLSAKLNEVEVYASGLEPKVKELEAELYITKARILPLEETLQSRNTEIRKLLDDLELIRREFTEFSAAKNTEKKEMAASYEKALREINVRLEESHRKLLASDKELQVNGRELNGVNALFKDVIGFAKQFCRKQCNRAGRCEQTRCNMFYLLKTLGASPDPPPSNQKY